ncbi:23S rRNA (guanosine(2251)-2'-O)-methyltransferase RlmB [Oceanibaculum indicum]|uniref:TrmH family RNA methyltransferase n=1 Tax=Oceanibaculum indicum P24 TaxID=1207063 RepID=K2JTY6_9PROT|nr:23S rRNA (guanosine(2251)-2'-O)-methyltransferase RlmB [Oceanibaculum indicum]EKE68615.1 TrmH family RNA methyltransferase [Oceanibaculum indicum P24]
MKRKRPSPSSARPGREKPASRPASHDRQQGHKPGHSSGGPRRGGADPARFLWGVHAVRAALANPARRCRRLLVTAQARESVADILPATLAVDMLDRQALDALLPDAVHQGIALEVEPLDEPDIEDVLESVAPDAPLLLVVLDQVTDPHNVGAILRSAAAFGAAAMIVQERHSPPVTGTLAKSASGGVEIVPMVRVTNLARALDRLREAGVFCLGFDSEAEHDLQAIDPGARVALVMGAEGPGLRRLTRERCDMMAKLPTQGPVASLNVSNAAAIALYDMARRLIKIP